MTRTIPIALAFVATALLGLSSAAAQGPKPWAGYGDAQGRPPLDCFFPPKEGAHLPKEACPPGSPGVAAVATVDTSQWKGHDNQEVGFGISAPPDWVKIDLSSVGSKMTLKHDMSGVRSLMCMVFAYDEPRSTQISQQEINEGLLRGGPVSPQEWEDKLRSTGQPYRVLSSWMEKIMNQPANLYEASNSIQSMDAHYDQRTLGAVLNVPGRNFTLNCSVYAENGAQAQELYQHWLPTFRAIFASFILEPVGR
jgi:hypothetical protein